MVSGCELPVNMIANTHRAKRIFMIIPHKSIMILRRSDAEKKLLSEKNSFSL